MSNISNQHDGKLDIETNETPNVSMLIAPTILLGSSSVGALYQATERNEKWVKHNSNVNP